MKKLFALLVFSFTIAVAQSQVTVDCASDDQPVVSSEALSAGCGYSWGNYANSNYVFSITYPNVITKYLKLNFVVIQKTDISDPGNFTNSPAHLQFFDNLVAAVNGIYANLVPPGGSCPTISVLNTKIQFFINGVYFIQDDFGWNNHNYDYCPGTPSQYLVQNHLINPQEAINIFFDENLCRYERDVLQLSTPSCTCPDSPYGRDMCNSFGCGWYPDWTHYNSNSILGSAILLHDRYTEYFLNPGVGGAAVNLAHELGHNLGLAHVTTCNNLMNGGGGNHNFLTEDQMGQIQRNLMFQDVRKYVKDYPYDSGNQLLISQNETWNFDIQAYSDIIVQSGNTLTLTCRVSLPDGAKIVVQPGATLIVDGATIDNNFSTVGWNGLIDIKDNATLILKSNSLINLANGGKILIEGGDGHLIYYPNARINLNGITAQLEIAGYLDIQDNATFQPLCSASNNLTLGSVKFSSLASPSLNVIAGNNCSFILRSNLKQRKMLYVAQEGLFAPDNLIEFTLEDGTAIMYPVTVIQTPVSNTCQINIVNAQVTTLNNIQNAHEGLRLFGQPNLNITNSTFANGKFGIFSYTSILGSPLILDNCEFNQCTNGLYSYDKSVNLIDCKFTNCNVGWYGEQMSLTSKIMGGHAFNNTEAVFYQGVSVLDVYDPKIDNNAFGLTGLEASIYINCGSISSNTYNGITLKDGATLFMDAEHEPVTAIDNEYTIKCSKANNVYLNLGYNSLAPIVTGLQKTLFGTFLCQTYGLQVAKKNNWDGIINPLSVTEYNITTDCNPPVNVVFADPYGYPETPCGQAIPPCPSPCTLSPLTTCTTCEEIQTQDYNDVPLNTASLDAQSYAENNLITDNEKEAVDRYNQILTAELDNISAQEDYILKYNYERMKESYADAFTKNQLLAYNSSSDAYVAKMAEVQDQIIDKAELLDLYNLKFYSTLEKAQTYRTAGKLEDALLILEDALLWCTEDDYEFVDRIHCMTLIERDAIDGIINPADIPTSIEACSSFSPERRPIFNEPTKSSYSINKLSLYPNPAYDYITVTGNSDHQSRVIVSNIFGQPVLVKTFTNAADFSIENLSSGLYFYQIKDDFGNKIEGKFVKK
jgi:hypothetical protein